MNVVRRELKWGPGWGMVGKPGPELAQLPPGTSIKPLLPPDQMGELSDKSPRDADTSGGVADTTGA